MRALAECVRMYEDAASWRRPPEHSRAPVVAVALNTVGLSDDAASARIASARDETRLPVADPVREGPAGGDLLAAAITRAAEVVRPAHR